MPQSLIDRVFAEAGRFHDLPEDHKLTVRDTERVVGCLSRRGQTQTSPDHARTPHPDTSASFYLCREVADPPNRLAEKSFVFGAGNFRTARPVMLRALAAQGQRTPVANFADAL